MRQLPGRIKPTKGFSHFLHIGYKVLLPVLAIVLVRIDFVLLAVALIILSKWRMFAVRPRYWRINALYNGIDIFVAISLVLFMANTSVYWWQLLWMFAYMGWLVVLKPRSDVLSVSLQAMIGQLLALSALYLKFGDTPLIVLVFGTWGIAYVSARHFLASFSENHSSMLAHSWAYFAGSLAFVLVHWLLFYGNIPQIVLLLSTIGYGLAGLYYLHSSDRLSAKIQRQLLLSMCMIVLVIIIFSDWNGNPV